MQKRKYLIVVDMQNDFVDGSLGTKEAQAIVPRVREIVKQKREEGYFIVFTIGDVGVQKNTFGYDAWDVVLGNTTFGVEVEEIELIGLCTDICVVSNALILKALYPEVPIKVDSTACAGVTPESHEAALATMRMCQIEVL